MADSQKLVDELCENFAASFWAKGANDEQLDPYISLFKSGPASLKGLSETQLTNIQANLAIWIHEITDEEGNRFADIIASLIEGLSEELESLRAGQGK